MADTPYADVLARARRELASAEADRLRLEARIARLKRTVLALSSLVEQPAIDPTQGITECIKAILRQMQPHGLYATTLRLKLEEAGFDFSKSKNPLASIHTILKRLVDRDLVETKTKQAGTAFFWKGDEGNRLHDYMRTFGADLTDPDDMETETIIRIPGGDGRRRARAISKARKGGK